MFGPSMDHTAIPPEELCLDIDRWIFRFTETYWQ